MTARLTKLASQLTKTMSTPKPNITLYTDQTPNGVKISITLEELGLPYKTHHLNISTNVQKEQWFLDINPNGRIPAITDTFEDGETIRLFESGSVQQYLVERYDTEHKISYPRGTREYYETNNWLFFLNAGVGPMQGQANHFFRYAPEKIQYGINRYQNETRRLYKALDTHLSKTGSDYLVGDKCTIADIAHYGWIAAAAWAGVDIKEFPTLEKWDLRMSEREGVKKGQDVPSPFKFNKNLTQNPEEMEKEAKKASGWIMKGQEADAKK